MMKKKSFVLFFLVAAMLLNSILPCAAASAKYVGPATWTHTEQLYDTNSNTGLDAYYGTPTLDGKIDEAWSEATPLILNSDTKASINNAGFSSSLDAEYAILWDAENLYFLEVCNNALDIDYTVYNAAYAKKSNSTVEYWDVNSVGKFDGCMYNILPPKNQTTIDSGVYDGYMIFALPTADSKLPAVGVTTEGTVRVRSFDYKEANKNWSSNNPSKYWLSYTDSDSFGLEAYYTVTETGGYIMETKIPWSFLGVDTDDLVPNSYTLGLKINPKSGYHINSGDQTVATSEGTVAYTNINPDAIGHDPVTIFSNDALPITPDTEYWSGLATPVSEGGQQIWEISSAQQLLGLSESLYNNADGETLTAGRTFLLTKDIDLNPGVDWTAYRQKSPDPEKLRPINVWKTLGIFAGTFDGQGHTVRGVWNEEWKAGDTICNDVSFIGRLKSGTVKNLILDDGRFAVSEEHDTSNVSLGAIVGTLHSGDASLLNCYVGKSFTVNGTALNNTGESVGGLVGSNYTPTGLTQSLTIQSCAFAGTLILPASTAPAIGKIIGKAQQVCNTLTMSDCVFTGTLDGTRQSELTELGLQGTINTITRSATSVRLYESAAKVSEAYLNDSMYLAQLTDGTILPVAVADMLAGMFFQTNQDSSEIRLINEVNSLAWNTMGYDITFYRVNGAVTKTIHMSNTENTRVYSAVLANGKEIAYDDSYFDVLNGIALCALRITDIDPTQTYAIKVTPVWTFGETTVTGATRNLKLVGEQRILVVTDIHYTNVNQFTDNRDKGFYGVLETVRMESLVRNINAEYEKDPFEMILFLGDYSLDYWNWQHGGSWIKQNTSYTQKLIEEYAKDLPDVPMFWLAGNHEQYYNSHDTELDWVELTGNERQGHIVLDNYLFIMWDAFKWDGTTDSANYPEKDSDGSYTAPNVDEIRAIMDLYPDKRVILVSHSFAASNTEKEKALIQDDRVVCMFVGHDHSAKVTSAYGRNIVLHAGNYSYYNDSTYEDAQEYMWGFRDLYLGKESVTSRYIVPANTAYPGGRELTVEYHYQDEITIPLS